MRLPSFRTRDELLRHLIFTIYIMCSSLAICHIFEGGTDVLEGVEYAHEATHAARDLLTASTTTDAPDEGMER
jgi:hypothetical protein